MKWRHWALGVIGFTAFVGMTVFFWDPLLWQRYVGTMMNANDPEVINLYPTEAVINQQVRELPVPKAGERTVSDDALKAMADYAARFDSYGLVVLHKGVVQSEWYRDGWDRYRFTQSQSMHKSLLPILIRFAIEDGVIASVDDPVGQYIKEWAKKEKGKITIKQLMTMSSGLYEYPFSLNPFSDAFQWLFSSETTDILLDTPLDHEPGTQFVYNNVNSEILGLIIERTTGKRYSEYLAEKLWQPLGNMPAQVWVDEEGGKAHTSCCLLASTMDWARFGAMLAKGGLLYGRRIVDEDWIEEMVTPSELNPWYGYQIWLGYQPGNPRTSPAGGYQQTEPFLADDTYYASGYGAQRVYVVPSEELVIVRMGPADVRSPLKPGWDNSFLVNTALRGLKRTADDGPARPSALYSQ